MTRRILAFILAIAAILMIHIQTADAIVLREGSRGTEVTRIQQRLIELGFLHTRATGVFGPATKDAVIRFQRANRLTADGVVGRATTSALFPSSASRSPVTRTTTSALREGSRGAEVTRIQRRLIELGFLNTRATGVFGPATRDAVIRFQRANGLTSDGIVGPTTIRVLFPSNQQANSTTNTITTILRRGSRGAQVTTLQNRLRELGLLNVNANGIFGPLTQSAVKQFQSTNGMTVNGIADTITVQRLFEQPSVNPTPPSVLPEPTPPNQEPIQPAQPETIPPAQPEAISPAQPDPNIPLVRFHGTAGALVGRTVIIDPGHGGFDPGAVRNGVLEKDLVLDVSLRLRRMLEEAGATVLMTRETDVFRSLLFRSAFANKHVLQLEVERLQREGVGIPTQQTPSLSITADSTKQSEQAMQALIALQIELAQIQQRQSDITAQIIIINEMLSVLNALDEDNAQLKKAIEASDNDAAASERSQIFQKELQLADLAARIGLPGSTRDVANSSLLSRQAEIAQITNRINELRNQIAAAQRSLEQPVQTSDPIPVQPQPEVPSPGNSAALEAINMWNSKISMFDHYINNPHLESRGGIFALSRDSSNNLRANEMLTRVFDLTRERYQDNIVFISVHINSTTQNATDSSGIRMFYRHNGPTFAWGVGNPHYYLNYNGAARRSLSQSLLNSLNAFTDFQGEVVSPLRMDFSVIRETNLVSSLIEIGFINNQRDRELMLQEQFRENSAAGIYTGLVNYFNSVR